MTELQALSRVLRASVERKGEVPLTNAHLLNIVNMAMRYKDRQEAELEKALNDAMGEDKKWGSS